MEVFKQSFNYAHIKLFKNYSDIKRKNILLEHISDLTKSAVSSEETDPLKWEVPMTIKKYVVSAVKKEKVYDVM